MSAGPPHQVVGVEVRRQRLRRLVGNLGPGELHSREMRGFNGGPQAQPMNPLFKPVMIRRHNEEQDDECRPGRCCRVVLAGSNSVMLLSVPR